MGRGKRDGQLGSQAWQSISLMITPDRRISDSPGLVGLASRASTTILDSSLSDSSGALCTDRYRLTHWVQLLSGQHILPIQGMSRTTGLRLPAWKKPKSSLCLCHTHLHNALLLVQIVVRRRMYAPAAKQNDVLDTKCEYDERLAKPNKVVWRFAY